MSFNLNIYKKSMGWSWWQGRPNFVWWNYDDLVSNPPDSWNKAISDPNYGDDLGMVFRDAEATRDKWIKNITNMYPEYTSQVDKMVKLYIGFHPSYGGYITSIGPYKGKKEGGQHRFGYFTWRKSPATESSIEKSITTFAGELNKKYGIEISPEDLAPKLELVIKTPVAGGRFRPVRRVNGLDVDNPDYVKLIEDEPMLGKNSTFELNEEGLQWFMPKFIDEVGKKEGWLPLFMDLATERASKKNLDISTSMQDGDFLRKTYQHMISSLRTDPGLAGQYNIDRSIVKTAKISMLAGQQAFTELRTNLLMKREMQLKAEILELMSRGFTKDEILEALNNIHSRQKQGRRRDPVTGEMVSYDRKMLMSELDAWLSILQKEALIFQEDGSTDYRDPLEMKEEIDKALVELDTKQGFTSLAEAFKYLKQYVTTSRIDPVTKAKANFASESTFSSFNPPDDTHITGLTTTELSGIENKPTEDVLYDISDSVEPVVEEVEEVTKPVVEEVEEVGEVGEEGDDNVKKVFRNTLIQLLKIAAELDNEGKNCASEEIHQVIRKYQKRI